MRQRGAWLVAVVLVAALVPVVRADDKQPDVFTRTLAKAVMVFVRPSSYLHKEGKYLPAITSYKYAFPKQSRVDLTVKMDWYGLWTKDPYQSTFTIKMDFDGQQVMLREGIDYTDDCLVPAPDLRLVNRLIRELNKLIDDRIDPDYVFDLKVIPE